MTPRQAARKESEPSQLPDSTSRPSRKRLGVVLTGGTIGSEVATETSTRETVVSLSTRSDLAVLRKAVERDPLGDTQPAIREPLRRLSEDMVPSDWLVIADAIRSLVSEGAERVLVLHGTDTATFTTAALSFLIWDVPVPVVVTGSNYPPDEPRSDAPRNVTDALVATANLEPGVFLSFAGSPASSVPSWVHLGTTVRKLQASGQAFYSINRPPIARVRRGQFEPRGLPPERQSPLIDVSGDHQFAFEERVLFVKLFPGCDLSALLQLVQLRGTRGVVIELYPSGTGLEHADATASSAISLPDFIRGCVDQGTTVVCTVAMGPTSRYNHYESTLALQKAGAIFTLNLIPETALVKLMWALGLSSDFDEIAAQMLSSVSGELPEL